MEVYPDIDVNGCTQEEQKGTASGETHYLATLDAFNITTRNITMIANYTSVDTSTTRLCNAMLETAWISQRKLTHRNYDAESQVYE